MDYKRRVTIQCPLCAVTYDPSETKTNICPQCLVLKENITENLSSNEIVQQCTHCKRYNRPPWVLCDRESKELLAICLKKVRGLDKLKLIDAQMIFTEPSTKTLKIRITVQKEVMNEASLQQTHIVEFREEYKQCDDCRKEFTPHTWLVNVQVRQRVEHKKTFLHLEQLMLQNHMQDKALRIEAVDDGLDFFYKSIQSGREMVQFMQGHLPVKVKHSTELVSEDFNNNKSHIKQTFSVQLPRVCKGNLIMLPPKLAQQLGGLPQILLCYKVTSIIHLYDPLTLRCTELTADRYFQYEVDIQVFEVKNDGAEFTVIDLEKLNPKNYNYVHASLLSKCVQVQVMKETCSDYQQYSVKCHLGNISIGSTVLGFDLTQMNNALSDCSARPEIVLVQVKKDRVKNHKPKLNRLNVENVPEIRKPNKKQGINQINMLVAKQEDKEDEEIQEYLDEVEDDLHDIVIPKSEPQQNEPQSNQQEIEEK